MEINGICRAISMTPLPYQVVIAGELEGREYAAFRALSDRTNIGDVSAILDAMKICSLKSRDRYFSILQTIEAHNPGQVWDMIREENKIMRDIFLDLFEPEIQERERKAAKAAAEAATNTVAKAAAEAATTAAFNTFAERLINKGFYGPDIVDVTGYDRSHIDSIAKRLNRSVRWNESKV